MVFRLSLHKNKSPASVMASTATAIYRYSVRSFVAACLAWAVMFFPGSFLFAVSISQMVRTGEGVSLLFIIGLPLLFWVVGPIVWLRDRPTLSISENGIAVSSLGIRRCFIPWSGVQAFEDIRRVNVRTNKRLRFFHIVWTGGVVTFNQFYTELPRLLESLNQQVALHHIPVSIRS